MNLVRTALLALALGGCGVSPTEAPAPSTELARSMQAYANEPATRRRALEVSIVNAKNAYSRLRLARYDEASWGALPVFEPLTTPMTSANVAARPSVDSTWTRIEAERSGWEETDLRELGERAFYNYPMQLAPHLAEAASSPDSAGMWNDAGRFGPVWVSLPMAGVTTALTCATCHASKDARGFVPGRNNADLDATRIFAGSRAPWAWPLGTVDVTDDGLGNPVAIADLRPVRLQKNLHHAATLVNSPSALAVRIETLIITSLGESVRPPRKVVSALTVYLMSLSLPALPSDRAVESGRAIFVRACAGCHRDEAMSGPPVALDVVGTNPSVAESPDRTTGSYRVPSLRGVGDRRRLFASGEVEDVAELLSPDRRAHGHRYGLELDSADRAALLRYLRAL